MGAGGLPPHDWLHALLDLIGCGPAGGRQRQCPAHEDPSPSLSIAATEDGRVLLHCHAGCDWWDALDALHLSGRHLFAAPWTTPERHHRTWPRSAWPSFPAVAVRPGGGGGRGGLRWEADHFYSNGAWKLERWRRADGEKSMLWFTRDADGGYVSGLLGVPTRDLPLYREREVRMAVGAGEPVVVCESESSVDALNAVGLYAVTWAGGASAPNLGRLASVLAGAVVVLVPDHDDPGLTCGRAIWSALHPVAESIRVVVPDPGQDARDLLAACGPTVFTIPDK